MERRFYPPKDKRPLLERLVGDESPFSELRDVLFFCACLGWRMERREPLEARGEGIRWDVMTNRLGTEAVTAMMAAAETQDPQVLLADRAEDRVAIMEEYANGGLVELERLIAVESRPLRQVLLTLMQQHLDAGDVPDGVDLAKQILSF